MYFERYIENEMLTKDTTVSVTNYPSRSRQSSMHRNHVVKQDRYYNDNNF